jgi:hypothetical protein
VDDSWTEELDGWPAQMLAHIPPQDRGGEVHVHLHLHQAPQLPAAPPTQVSVPTPDPVYPVPYPDNDDDLLGYQRVREVTVRPVEEDLPRYGWWARNWPRVGMWALIATGAGLVGWLVLALVSALSAAVTATGHAVAGAAPWVLAIGAVVLLLMLLGGGKGGGGTFTGSVSGTWR